MQNGHQWPRKSGCVVGVSWGFVSAISLGEIERRGEE